MSLTHALPYDYDVVTRRVNQRAASLRNVLLHVPFCVGSLYIDEPFAMSGDLAKPSWHARGRLYGRGLRIVRYTRVEIEVHAWSQYATELRLRPVTRRVVNWGKRRQCLVFPHRALRGRRSRPLDRERRTPTGRGDDAAATPVRRPDRRRPAAGAPVGRGFLSGVRPDRFGRQASCSARSTVSSSPGNRASRSARRIV